MNGMPSDPMDYTPDDGESPIHGILKRREFELPDKQARYEVRLGRQLLAAMGMDSLVISGLVREQGEGFGFTYLNEQFFGTQLAMASRKLRRPVTMETILKGIEGKSEWFDAFLDARDNWPTAQAVAVVFDWHGDKVPDLVVHNAEWFANYRGGTGEWSLRFHLGDHGPFFVQPWKGFVRAAGASFPV